MLNVIFEDNHLLVVEKPVNILSQGDNTNDDDMVNLLKKYLKEKYNKPGNVFVGLVHRLDRPVGGIMVFAKTSKAASRLSEQVRNKTFKKTYKAVIHGDMKKREDNLSDYLYKDKKTNMVSVVNKWPERSGPWSTGPLSRNSARPPLWCPPGWCCGWVWPPPPWPGPGCSPGGSWTCSPSSCSCSPPPGCMTPWRAACKTWRPSSPPAPTSSG